MKIGIVVPFSWSYWGGVVEHSENQAAALRQRGHDVRILMGHDPPGVFTRVLHPRSGRHGDLPRQVIPLGRSIVVPANGSLPNIVLSPRSVGRIRAVLRAEQFDLLHLHEPLTPAICVATLAFAECPVVATWHAAGDLAWMRVGVPVWGFLIDRVETRIAVSRMAAESAERWLGPGFEIVPNGVVVPAHADPEHREHRIVFIARLRLIGTDPLQYRLLHTRMRFDEDGIDVLGIVPNEERDAELAASKLFVSPALGGESFGMVLVEAFATATPVVASDIPGFADVATADAAVLVPPGDERALADAICGLLADEERRVAMGRAGRALADSYSWDGIAARLEAIYERAVA
jgi:phosphatidylinositol alpha-mannosyltransferase